MEKPFLPINICMKKPFDFSGQTSNVMTRKNHSPPYYINAADDDDDDEYIEIEIKSFSPQNTDFEFNTVFPVDDLFYKGKLLPPKLQTLQDYYNNSVLEENDDFIIMDFPRSMSRPSKNNTTQVEPTRLSFSFNLDKLPEKKYYSWLSKLRLIKKSFSLKSFFRKSSCIDFSSALDTKLEQKKTLFGNIGIMWRHKVSNNINHTRSFSFSSSAEYKRRRSPSSSSGASSSTLSSSLSSTSFSSSDFLELNFHNRSCRSFTSDIEEAIVHCKKPQQLCNSRKSFSKSGHFALSTPKIATKFGLN